MADINIFNNYIIGLGLSIDPSIETDIWNKDKEKVLLDMQEAKDTVINSWASKNLSMPDGALVSQIIGIDKVYQDNRLNMSTGIASGGLDVVQNGMEKSFQPFADIISSYIKAEADNQINEIDINTKSQISDMEIDAKKKIAEDDAEMQITVATISSDTAHVSESTSTSNSQSTNISNRKITGSNTDTNNITNNRS